MAAIALADLTRSERAAYSAVWGSLRRGATATGALESYRRAGGRIRSQSWYALFSALKGIRAQQSGLSGLLPHESWTARQLPKAVSRLTRRYSYQVVMHGIQPRQSGDEAYFVTVSSSKLLTRAQAESTALSAISEYAADGFQQWAQPELVSGLRSGAFGFEM